MRNIQYAGQSYDVAIVSLSLPRDPGLMSRGHPMPDQRAHLTMLSAVELPVGARFLLHNPDHCLFAFRVRGCARSYKGRFLVLGVAE
jgi:hypothetical protein